MPYIELSDASVEFAIYNANSRSLRRDILNRVGGKVGASEADRVTVQALSNISLSLRPGDRLGIVGHNGSGKSTLLRVLSGTYEPSSGTAVIRGKVSSLLDVTMGMDTELTGRENIVLRGVFLGMRFSQARALVPEIVEFSELGSYIDLPVRTYSSGMVLRLAFAVSTAVQPDIMLLDEMISVGDAGFAAKAKQRLDKLAAAAGILVFASHSHSSLRSYCKTAIGLSEGRIVSQGPLEQVLQEMSDAPKQGIALAG